MKNNWSKSDVNAVKVILDKAKLNAEKQIMNLFKKENIRTVSDIFAMELKIRKWRRDFDSINSFCYNTVGKDIKTYLQKGWLTQKDLSTLTDERKQKLKL